MLKKLQVLHIQSVTPWKMKPSLTICSQQRVSINTRFGQKPNSKSTYRERETPQGLMKQSSQARSALGEQFGWELPSINQLKQGNHRKSRRCHPEGNICKDWAHNVPAHPLHRLGLPNVAPSLRSSRDMDKNPQTKIKNLNREALSHKENSKKYLTHNFIPLCCGVTCSALGSNRPKDLLRGIVSVQGKGKTWKSEVKCSHRFLCALFPLDWSTGIPKTEVSDVSLDSTASGSFHTMWIC